MRRLGYLRPAALAATLSAVGLVVSPAAAAPPIMRPPIIDPGLLPAPGAPAKPPEASEQRAQCARPVLTAPPPRRAPLPLLELDLSRAWQFSRGQGQVVAVIDTGVNRHPRLPGLLPGGDYVSDGDGTVDCDGHGTLVAGIIAAQPSPDDGFAGVAPDSTILSIRQLSLEYGPKDFNHQNGPGSMAHGGFGTVSTLAMAIVHAVDLGATVINISEVSCAAAGTDTADGPLGAAIRYSEDHNVVVVAAAGNVDSNGACKTQNGTGWAGVQTIATPAWFGPDVLSVGSVDPGGAPSQFSLAGPWVSVAAPGTRLYSLDSAPGATGLVDAVPGTDGPPNPIGGTSFASAYVSGVAALVRSRFPQLPARAVMDRIIRTAHSPGGGHDDRVGFGIVDPVAALTAQLPDQPSSSDIGRPVPPPIQAKRMDPRPRGMALTGALICLLALVAGIAVTAPFRRAPARRLTEGVDY